MEPKSIEEVPNWVIVNALRCPVDAQISIVAKLLQHLDSDQRNQALSMSGVVGRSKLFNCDCERPIEIVNTVTHNTICMMCGKIRKY
jgi:hypothetical protein